MSIEKLKQLKQIDWKSLNWKPSGAKQAGLLFFYTDGIQISGAVITKEGDSLTITASAQSTDLSEQALSNILTELSTHVESLPNQAIMLHSRMALGLLDLPAAENNKLGKDKIANIVRWEMETLYHEQSPQWNIGSLLTQLGILTEAEREAILTLQKQDRLLNGKAAKFGEIAVTEEKIDPTELEKYLTLQQEIQEDDSTVKSGWYQPTKDSTLFCAAMNAKEQQRWLTIFAETNLHIARFYPVCGTLSSLLDEEPLQYLLELHLSSLVFSVLKDGVIQSMDIINTMERSLSINDLSDLIQHRENPSAPLYLWGIHPSTDDFFTQLKTQLGDTLLRLQPPVNNIIKDAGGQKDFLYPLLGVAQDYFFQHLNNGRVPYVEAMPPLPKFYQQKKWQIGTGIFLALLIMLGVDSYYQKQATQAAKKIQKTNKEYRSLKKSNKKVNRSNARFSKFNTELTQLKRTHRALQSQKKAVEVNLIKRQKFMREFLTLLINSVDQEVVLDNLIEDSWYQFRVSGWALNLAAVSRFEKALIRHLSPFKMQISKSPSSLLKSGDLAGAYRFDFQLVRNDRPIKI